jgi:hypothetical protein
MSTLIAIQKTLEAQAKAKAIKVEPNSSDTSLVDSREVGVLISGSNATIAPNAGDINIQGGEPNKQGIEGGDITLSAGNGYYGGNIFIYGGKNLSDPSPDLFGNITLQTGGSDPTILSTENTGTIFISTGSVSGEKTSGEVSITTGAPHNHTNSYSGDISIESGSTSVLTDAGHTGTINIKTGQGGSDESGIINILSGNTSSANSGNVLLKSGETTTGQSGSLSLGTGRTLSGNSGNVGLSSGVTDGNGNSGNLNITSGEPEGSGNSGLVYVSSGAVGSGNSGIVFLTSGGSGTGNSGTLYINSSSAGRNSGNLYIQSGNSNINGESGSITLKSGNVTDNTKTSGQVSIYSGDSGTGSGAINIYSGESDTSNDPSGAINLTSGDNTGLGDSGDINLETGTGIGSGGINLTTGSSTTSASGIITLQTGDNTDVQQSGDINILTGDTNGAASGDVNITTGTNTNGDAGDINIKSGPATGQSGTITIDAQSSTGATSAGGDVIVKTGNQTDNTINQKTGKVSIFTGAHAGGNRSGEITIETGNNTGTSNTGFLRLGTGISDTQDSGDVTIQSGFATNNSGTVVLRSGQSITNASGNVNIYSGDNTVTDTGDVNVYSGDARNTSGDLSLTTGSGSTINTGDINITTGDAANTSNGNTGDINLIVGDAYNAGVKGEIKINSNSAPLSAGVDQRLLTAQGDGSLKSLGIQILGHGELSITPAVNGIIHKLPIAFTGTRANPFQLTSGINNADNYNVSNSNTSPHRPLVTEWYEGIEIIDTGVNINGVFVAADAQSGTPYYEHGLDLWSSAVDNTMYAIGGTDFYITNKLRVSVGWYQEDITNGTIWRSTPHYMTGTPTLSPQVGVLHQGPNAQGDIIATCELLWKMTGNTTTDGPGISVTTAGIPIRITYFVYQVD